MTVRLVENVVRLEGPCLVEDAEPLLQLLLDTPDRAVDLADAQHLHAAVVQVLIALRPRIQAGSRDPFVSTWIEPMLSGEVAQNHRGASQNLESDTG